MSSIFAGDGESSSKNFLTEHITYLAGIRSVWQSLRTLSIPIGIMAGIVLSGVWIGYLKASDFPIPLPGNGIDAISSRFGDLLKVWPYFSFKPVMQYWWQNLRVLLLGLPLGFISFGVLGVLPTFASMALTGYLMGILATAGIPVSDFLVGFILPHGIFEIPAAIIASAAILKMGAGMAKPDPVKSVSEVWLQLFATWSKILLGVVIPLLLIAAFMEAWVTPRIALIIFK